MAMQTITGLSERTLRVINLAEIQTSNTGCNGCFICGRPLKNEEALPWEEGEETYWLHLTTTGYLCEDNSLIPEEGDEPHAIGQGWWQVGKTCYENYLKIAKTMTLEEFKQLKNNKSHDEWVKECEANK